MRRCMLISLTIRENSSLDGLRRKLATESSSSAISSRDKTLGHEPMVDTSKYALGRFRTRGDDVALASLMGEDEWYMRVANGAERRWLVR